MKPYTVVYKLIHGTKYSKISLLEKNEDAALETAKTVLLQTYPLIPFDLVAIVQAEFDCVRTFKVWVD